jgi:Flp pilus assembly protein TadG
MKPATLAKAFATHPPRTGASRQRGAVALVVGLLLPVLLGAVGLALDSGHLYLTRTELQNGADACALAASYELTGSPAIPAAAFNRAEAAGRAVARQNKIGFQGMAIADADVSVSFGSGLSAGSAWVAAGAAAPSTKYVRCTVTRANIAPWFMQVLGAGPQTVNALATATLSPARTTCAIPMALCVRPGGSAPTFGYVKGDWYGLDFSESGNNASYTGNFRWIDFDPSTTTPGCSGGGAQELACLMAGAGQCSLPAPNTGTCSTSGNAKAGAGCVGQTGNISSMESAYNSRFGLYKGGSGNPQISTAVPDLTGYAYGWEGGKGNWPLGRNAYSGTSGTTPNFTQARASTLGTVQASGLSPAFYANPYSPSTAAQHLASGADRRRVTMPIVDCSGFTGAQHAPIRGYACVLLLDPYRKQGNAVRSKVEYLGASGEAGSPCSTSGISGDSASVGPMVPALVQ